MIEKIETKEQLYIGRRIVAFIGPEGSGKTTHAKRLAAETGKPYVTTGDIIRDLAKNDLGRLGEACRVMFAEQRYLDGATLLEILVNRFRSADTEEGFILDGGFRTLEETINFQSMLLEADRDLPMTVLSLRIPSWMTFERLVTGPGARKRFDDTVEGLTGRLTKFYYQLPHRVGVIKANENWELEQINAAQSIEEVYEEIALVLANKGKAANL